MIFNLLAHISVSTTGVRIIFSSPPQGCVLYIRLHHRGAYLAVLAENGGFWLCRASSDVWLDAHTFSASWLEQETVCTSLYKKQTWVVKLELSSLLGRVKMVREKETGYLRLPWTEKLRLELLLKKLEDGYKLQAYDKDHDQVS